MKVEIFTLCDFSRVEPTGKMYVIGTFDNVFTPNTPAKYPMCSIAARIRFDKAEEGVKRVKIAIIDADGASIAPSIETQMTVQSPPGASSAILQFAAIIQQINLPHYGEYSIDLVIDGRGEASVPLFVRQLPHPQLPGTQPGT
jgi:hypothetical protein